MRFDQGGSPSGGTGEPFFAGVEVKFNFMDEELLYGRESQKISIE